MTSTIDITDALTAVPDGFDVRDVEQFLYREARLRRRERLRLVGGSCGPTTRCTGCPPGTTASTPWNRCR